MNEALQAILINSLRLRLELVEKRHRYLSFLIDNRKANEKFLQLEIMNIISSMPGIVDFLPEKPYDSENSNDKCDFWFKTDALDYWLEIKTRPTNYRNPGSSGRAITDSVDQIIADIDRLRKIQSESSERLVIFAFYPLYTDSYDTFNKTHLSRIEEFIGRKIPTPDISIPVGDALFNVYLAII
jgi:hypothetical protein